MPDRIRRRNRKPKPQLTEDRVRKLKLKHNPKSNMIQTQQSPESSLNTANAPPHKAPAQIERIVSKYHHLIPPRTDGQLDMAKIKPQMLAIVREAKNRFYATPHARPSNRIYCSRQFSKRLSDLEEIYDGKLPDELEEEFRFMKLIAAWWVKLGPR